MAVIARRTFDLLKDEHVRRVGRDGDSNYTATSGRAEQFITSAYFDICRMWHHSELDATSTAVTLSASAASASIAAITDLDIVTAVAIRTVVGGTLLRGLRRTNDVSGLVSKAINATADVPAEYGRFGSALFFDVVPDQAYPTTIYYYKVPTAPDFAAAAASSALRRVWDEHILQYSVAMAQGALWVPEHVPASYQMFQQYAQFAPEVPMPQGNTAEKPKEPAPLGGAAG